MIKVENIEVFNFEGAIRGMRNPLNSWDKSDSHICYGGDRFDDCTGKHPFCPRKDDKAFENDVFCVGKADLDLMHRLFVAGAEHRKFLRQIFVSMDITAPLYWWKEFDTYKVGTTANSCSTMHTIHKRDLTLCDFSHEHLKGNVGFANGYSIYETRAALQSIIDLINKWRVEFLKTSDKDAWWQIIQLLPTSFNQKRTITMNYENVFNILQQRQGHKLDEWRELCEILKYLPYVREIGGIEDEIKSDS